MEVNILLTENNSFFDSLPSNLLNPNRLPERFLNAKQPPSGFEMLINKKTCIGRYPPANDFTTYRVFD